MEIWKELFCKKCRNNLVHFAVSDLNENNYEVKCSSCGSLLYSHYEEGLPKKKEIKERIVN